MKLSRFNPEKYFVLNPASAITISLIFWVYLIFRAWYVPFLHDEIMTLWYYVDTGNYLPFQYKLDFNAANNHVLNTMLTRFFSQLWGSTPFVLRFANLLFIPLYCYFAYRIANLLKNKSVAMLFWLCLLFIHSIIEFMALSRGYGMSFALLLGAIWYLFLVVESAKISNFLKSLLFVILSLAANLSLMSSALIIIGILTITAFVNSENIGKKVMKMVIIVILGILPLLFFMSYSFALQNCNALYYGSHDGFWTVTVTSLTNAFFGENFNNIRWVFLFYFIIILILLVRILIKEFSLALLKNKIFIFPALLIGNVVAILLLDRFYNVNFPEDRAAFYFYFFFVGSVFFLTESISGKFKKLSIAILIPFVLIPVHFLFASNFTHIAVYKQDRVPYRFYDTLKLKTEKMTEIPTIGTYRGRTMVLSYMNYLKNGNLPKSYYSEYPSMIPDFLIVNSKENEKWENYYRTLDYDETSGYSLLERITKLNRKTICSVSGIYSKWKCTEEYFGLMEGKLDKLNGSPLFFEYEMDIQSSAKPFEAWVVVAVSDSSGKEVAYEYSPLNWFRKEWNKENQRFHNGQLVTNLPETASFFKIYIWNINQVAFSIKNAKAILKKVEKDF